MVTSFIFEMEHKKSFRLLLQLQKLLRLLLPLLPTHFRYPLLLLLQWRNLIVWRGFPLLIPNLRRLVLQSLQSALQQSIISIQMVSMVSQMLEFWANLKIFRSWMACSRNLDLIILLYTWKLEMEQIPTEMACLFSRPKDQVMEGMAQVLLGNKEGSYFFAFHDGFSSRAWTDYLLALRRSFIGILQGVRSCTLF